MRVGVMVTNGGPHPPEKWAEQSAEKITDIIEIEPTYPNIEVALQQKNVLRGRLVETLINHHRTVQDHTRSYLADKGHDLAAPLNEFDMSPHVDAALGDAVGAVRESAKGTMFEGHFQQPSTIEFLTDTLRSHFTTSAQIEHSWHRDRQGK